MDALQIIWFVLVAVLLAVFYLTGGFDFGAGILIPFSKTRAQKDFIVRTILPFWDANQVWLITAGGGLFAAFPKAYATVLSQLYTPVMLLLMLLIVRVGSIEFYFLKDGDKWRGFWGWLIALSSTLCAAIFAVALAAAFSGQVMAPIVSPLAGLLGLFSLYGIFAGLLGVAFFSAHGAGFLAIKSKGAEFGERFAHIARKAYGFLPLAYLLYLALLLTYMNPLSVSAGFMYVLILLPVAGFMAARMQLAVRAFIYGALFALCFFAFHAAMLFPYLIAPLPPDSAGLTIAQAASSEMTLKIMLGVALVGVPLAIAYSIYAHRVFRRES